MLEACHVERRNESAGVLDVQCRFGRYAIIGKELIDCGPQELAIDENVEWDWFVIGTEEAVY